MCLSCGTSPEGAGAGSLLFAVAASKTSPCFSFLHTRKPPQVALADSVIVSVMRCELNNRHEYVESHKQMLVCGQFLKMYVAKCPLSYYVYSVCRLERLPPRWSEFWVKIQTPYDFLNLHEQKRMETRERDGWGNTGDLGAVEVFCVLL